jgi:hypothetical protein
LRWEHHRLMRYRADFNRVRKGRLSATVGFGGSEQPPSVGEIVQLFDGDDNTCFALVEAVDEELIRTQPIWETWRSGLRVSTDLMDVLRGSVRGARLRVQVQLPGEQAEGHDTRGVDAEVFDAHLPV